MKLEHFAYSVSDPVATARWYAEHLGMKAVRKLEEAPFTHFLADASGRTLIEFYNNPKVQVPDYPSVDPLLFHIAFAADDVAAECARLLEAGATAVDEVTVTPAGDTMAMLRDPWGVPVQLVQRAEAMP